MDKIFVTCKYGVMREVALSSRQIDNLLRGQPVMVTGDYVWLTEENYSQVVFDLSKNDYTHLEGYTLDLREYHIDGKPGHTAQCQVTFAVINRGNHD